MTILQPHNHNDFNTAQRNVPATQKEKSAMQNNKTTTLFDYSTS